MGRMPTTDRDVKSEGTLLYAYPVSFASSAFVPFLAVEPSSATPDLLLSIATAQWEEKDAREEIHHFVDEINAIGSGFSFD